MFNNQININSKFLIEIKVGSLKFRGMKLVNTKPLLSILYLIKHLSFLLCKTQGSRYLSQVKKPYF